MKIVPFAFAALLLTTSALAAQVKSGRCSDATLRGDYGVSLSGTRPVPGSNPIVFETIVGTGMITFDGEGGFTEIADIKGQSTGAQLGQESTGTYALNGNCSGSMTQQIPGLPFPLVFRFVLGDDGTEMRFTVIEPQAVMVTGTGRKVRTGRSR